MAVLGIVLFGLNAAEKFVDGRVEMKLAAQRQQQEDQAKRIRMSGVEKMKMPSRLGLEDREEA